MFLFVLKRVAALLPTFLLASLLVFVVIRLVPGDVIDMMLAQNDIGATQKTKEDLVAALGLDRPLLAQYIEWIGALFLKGDLGHSLWTGESVLAMILARLPTTLYLGGLSIGIALTIALPVGVLSAIRQDSAIDYIGRSIAIVVLSVPAFWLGTMAVVLPAMWFDLPPTTDYVAFWDAPLLSLRQMGVPALVLGIALSGITMRMTRTMVLEVLRQDYVRTAWAKGLDERTIVLRHVMKNALLPVITIVGLQIPWVLGGAVVIEQVFVVSGMGQLLLEAVSKRDYPVISGIFLLVGIGVMLVNLLVDLSYGLLDPKLRHG